MIIDIAYIKNVLGINDVDDSQISFLLNHYFDYLCDYLNVETTLKQEEILNENLPEPINNPNLINDDLTFFQETIIYAIAHHSENMNIPLNLISNELYNKVINIIDISTLNKNPNDDTKFILTYSDIYNNYLQLLNTYVNDMSSAGYVRRLLGLDSDLVSDSEIEFLIEHYKKYFKDTIANVDTSLPEFKQAIYLSVACQIFRTNPTAISSPTGYIVDEVTEYFNTSFDKSGNTWCDLADNAINDLKRKTTKNFGVKTLSRRGLRSLETSYGPDMI